MGKQQQKIIGGTKGGVVYTKGSSELEREPGRDVQNKRLSSLVGGGKGKI